MERGSLTTYPDLDSRSVYIRALAFQAAIGKEIALHIPQIDIDEAMAWAVSIGIDAGAAGSRGTFKPCSDPIFVAPDPEELAATLWSNKISDGQVHPKQ